MGSQLGAGEVTPALSFSVLNRERVSFTQRVQRCAFGPGFVLLVETVLFKAAPGAALKGCLVFLSTRSLSWASRRKACAG